MWLRKDTPIFAFFHSFPEKPIFWEITITEVKLNLQEKWLEKAKSDKTKWCYDDNRRYSENEFFLKKNR